MKEQQREFTTEKAKSAEIEVALREHIKMAITRGHRSQNLPHLAANNYRN